MTESKPLNQLSESIADGDAIDWDEVCALAGDDDIRQLLEHLRVVAGVAEVHRTQIAETIATDRGGAAGRRRSPRASRRSAGAISSWCARSAKARSARSTRRSTPGSITRAR